MYLQFVDIKKLIFFLIFCCGAATEAQSVDAIKARMEQVQVVGVTCLGMYHPLLAHKKFDTCIMDEAGQITLPVRTNSEYLVIVLVG
jgi:1-aminocyclopropane-1-carboxylate deaminase/D-cysteine desulfhydrase-like pyridoxal-dependent ACC family enzyme